MQFTLCHSGHMVNVKFNKLCTLCSPPNYCNWTALGFSFMSVYVQISISEKIEIIKLKA